MFGNLLSGGDVLKKAAKLAMQGKEQLDMGNCDKALQAFRVPCETLEKQMLAANELDARAILCYCATNAATAASRFGQQSAVGLLWAMKAVEYDPSNAKAREVLGRLYLGIGNQADGVRELEVAFDLNLASGQPDPGITQGIQTLFEHLGIQHGWLS